LGVQLGQESLSSLHRNGCPVWTGARTLHQKIADLSLEAHESCSHSDTSSLKAIEYSLDEQVAVLWALSSKELAAILSSIAALE
jgi:hypothetical protein